MNIKLAVLLSIAAMPAAATAQTNQRPAQPPAQKEAAASQERMYGSQLMTDAERAEYRAKMQALKTNEEREAFRLEHHKKMQERAREKGVTLPDTPPQQGIGQGTGRGMRQGMGSGMGQGKRQGPAAGGQQGPSGRQGGNPQQPPPK